MSQTDPHEVLGLPSGATMAEIRAAYTGILYKIKQDGTTDEIALARLDSARDAYKKLTNGPHIATETKQSLPAMFKPSQIAGFMQLEVQHPEFKVQRLTVEAAGAFHGPRLLLNGTVVKKQKGRYTVTADSGVETTIQLKYNYLDPIPKIKIGEKVSEIASSLKWYEYAWIGIPIVLVFSGGAIGGLCGGVAANASGRLFRSDRSSLAKYGLSALITMGAVAAYVVLITVFRLLVGTLHK